VTETAKEFWETQNKIFGAPRQQADLALIRAALLNWFFCRQKEIDKSVDLGQGCDCEKCVLERNVKQSIAWKEFYGALK
jgi:hypothetical protein